MNSEGKVTLKLPEKSNLERWSNSIIKTFPKNFIFIHEQIGSRTSDLNFAKFNSYDQAKKLKWNKIPWKFFLFDVNVDKLLIILITGSEIFAVSMNKPEIKLWSQNEGKITKN